MARGGGASRAPKRKPVTKRKNDRQVERPSAAELIAESQILPLILQQKCLDVFRDAMKSGLEDMTALQEVKGHLYDRNFATAFGKEEYLRVYAARWSPSRALGYAEIFAGLEEQMFADGEHTSLKINCLGGGAGAELVALAGWIINSESDAFAVNASLVDIADWTNVVGDLNHHIVDPRDLSKYASAAAIAANIPWVSPEKLQAAFQKKDVLEWTAEEAKSSVSDFDLITMMFTLNELYTASIPKTQRFLNQLTATMHPGALLLVVDSPGSYSTVTINGAEKKYPMQWLLDHTLLGPPDNVDSAPWEKLVSEDSKWYRLPEGLNYPIELENMRYQIHLYRRKAGD